MNCRHAASTCSAESACEVSGPIMFFFIIIAGEIVLQTSAVFVSPAITAVGFSPGAAWRHTIVAIIFDELIASWAAGPPIASSAKARPGIASAAQANAAESKLFFIVVLLGCRTRACARITVPHRGHGTR